MDSRKKLDRTSTCANRKPHNSSKDLRVHQRAISSPSISLWVVVRANLVVAKVSVLQVTCLPAVCPLAECLLVECLQAVCPLVVVQECPRVECPPAECPQVECHQAVVHRQPVTRATCSDQTRYNPLSEMPQIKERKTIFNHERVRNKQCIF